MEELKRNEEAIRKYGVVRVYGNEIYDGSGDVLDLMRADAHNRTPCVTIDSRMYRAGDTVQELLDRIAVYNPREFCQSDLDMLSNWGHDLKLLKPYAGVE